MLKSGLFKGYGKVLGSAAKGLNYNAMKSFATSLENFGHHAFVDYHSGYDISNATYYTKFARAVGAAGGIDWNWNTFSGYSNVEDLEEDNYSLIITVKNSFKP